MEVGWCVDHGLPHSELLSWDFEDRAKLIASLLETASRCQMCGTSEYEWDEDMDAYEAVSIMCRGCLIKEAASEDAPSIAGTRVTLVPKLTAEKMRDTPKKPPRRR